MLKQKLILTILIVFSFQCTGWAAFSTAVAVVTAAEKVNGDSHISIKENMRIAQMKFYSTISLKDYEKLKGRKLNYFERQSFKMNQHRMKKMIKKYDSEDGVTVLQKIGWLLKGLILGPLALLIGYLFLKDDERELIKWIWFGFAGFVVVLAIVLLTI